MNMFYYIDRWEIRSKFDTKIHKFYLRRTYEDEWSNYEKKKNLRSYLTIFYLKKVEEWHVIRWTTNQ